jgi:2-haloacid dehalogenase/putative hydrolase of the HAD superfamily
MAARQKAVLFDYGNVLVRWDPRTLYRTLFADPAEMDWFLANVCTLDWHLQHDAGTPMAVTTAELTRTHPKYAREIRAWDERFGEMIDGEIDGMVGLVERLRAAGCRIGVLTNMPADQAWTCLKVWSRWDLFDTVVVSGLIKAAKPDAQAFRVSLAALETAPADTFFTDDSAKNIAGARALGMPAHLFAGLDAGVADLESALMAHGFLT